jgi:hypothetical protein
MALPIAGEIDADLLRHRVGRHAVHLFAIALEEI